MFLQYFQLEFFCLFSFRHKYAPHMIVFEYFHCLPYGEHITFTGIPLIHNLANIYILLKKEPFFNDHTFLKFSNVLYKSSCPHPHSRFGYSLDASLTAPRIK